MFRRPATDLPHSTHDGPAVLTHLANAGLLTKGIVMSTHHLSLKRRRHSREEMGEKIMQLWERSPKHSVACGCRHSICFGFWWYFSKLKTLTLIAILLGSWETFYGENVLEGQTYWDVEAHLCWIDWANFKKRMAFHWSLKMFEKLEFPHRHVSGP